MARAVCIGDWHTCPLSEGPKPHVGGPVFGPPVGRRVFVAGRPVAVVGDQVMCVGPPDRIVGGVAGVLVQGTPAADGDARTAHGGTVAAVASVRFG